MIKRLLLCALLFCATVGARGYPRVGAYVGIRSGGSPLIFDNGTLDSATCQKFARFPQVALDMNALLISPNIVPTLIHFRPDIEIAGYHLTTHWYLDYNFVPQPSDKSFDAYWHLNIKNTNGFIIPKPPVGYEVNWGQKTTSDALGDLLVWGFRRLRVGAYFGDYFAPVSSWVPVGNEFTDNTRIANMSEMVAKLRAAMPDGFKAYGNGPGAEKCGLNGTLMEGYPNQLQASTFANAIKQHEGDWLKCEGSMNNKKAMRFMLGTACLSGATTTYGLQEVAPNGEPWPGTWWYDEWSVDKNGMPDPTGKNTGWLGAALGPFIKLANGLYIRYFEFGLVGVNPTGSTINQNVLYPRWKEIGSTVPVSVLSVPGNDAKFLWGD